MLKVDLSVMQIGFGLLEEIVRLPAGIEVKDLLHFRMSQLATAISLSGERLKDNTREVVRPTQSACDLFRQFNSHVRQKLSLSVQYLLLVSEKQFRIIPPFAKAGLIEMPFKRNCWINRLHTKEEILLGK